MPTCNPNKIASLLTAASLAIVAAIALYTVASILPSSWWTAAGAFAVMLIAAAVIAAAVGFVNGAAIEAANCTTGPCKSDGEKVLGALWALSATLSALLTATVVGAFGASIPWVGSAISIAMMVTATLSGVALLIVSARLLPDLQACLAASTGAAPSAAVAIQSVVGAVAGVVLLAFAGGFAGGVLHIPPIPLG